MRAQPHPDQNRRLASLRALGILDTPREAKYDEIVELVSKVCEAPIAIINLIDENRQWFKAEVGLGVRETPIETSICSHIILNPGLTIVSDTLNDPRFCDNPLCFTEPNLRFYAGMCLETSEGLPIGTLCVLDTKPRELTHLQKQFLSVLGNQVMVQINLAKQLRNSEMLRQEVDHRVRNSLSVVQSVLRLQARLSTDQHVKAELEKAGGRIASIVQVHEELHITGEVTEVDLQDFVTRLANSLSQNAGDRCKIKVAFASSIVSGKVASNVGLVINELVTNAMKHGLHVDGGEIHILGEFRDGRAWISVADNGQGLPADFDPEKSNGLGMRLTLLLTQGFGSTLTWTSTEGGSSFHFDLPAHA